MTHTQMTTAHTAVSPPLRLSRLDAAVGVVLHSASVLFFPVSIFSFLLFHFSSLVNTIRQVILLSFQIPLSRGHRSIATLDLEFQSCRGPARMQIYACNCRCIWHIPISCAHDHDQLQL